MSKPKYFQMYMDYNDIFQMMTDEEAGKTVKTLFTYATTGEVVHSDDKMVESVVFIITNQIKREFETYEEKCRKLSKNAKKRYEKANAGKGREEEDEDKEEDKEEDEEED